jgi:hypothetical protein
MLKINKYFEILKIYIRNPLKAYIKNINYEKPIKNKINIIHEISHQ